MCPGCAGCRQTRDGAASPGTAGMRAGMQEGCRRAGMQASRDDTRQGCRQKCRRAGIMQGRDAPRSPSFAVPHPLALYKAKGRCGKGRGLGKGGSAQELAGAGTNAAPGFQVF